MTAPPRVEGTGYFHLAREKNGGTHKRKQIHIQTDRDFLGANPLPLCISFIFIFSLSVFGPRVIITVRRWSGGYWQIGAI